MREYSAQKTMLTVRASCLKVEGRFLGTVFSLRFATVGKVLPLMAYISLTSAKNKSLFDVYKHREIYFYALSSAFVVHGVLAAPSPNPSTRI